ncbi:hypothetical protein L3i23_19700 [Herbiconiux sp. L3-i23]|nr:hypothetical protein L3i23_19700 [Herbiconiux sp. L3-i23]
MAGGLPWVAVGTVAEADVDTVPDTVLARVPLRGGIDRRPGLCARAVVRRVAAMTAVDDVKAEIDAVADPETGRFLQGFFKTGPGQYGEGDRFVGVRVPVLRRIAKGYTDLSPGDLRDLLDSAMHEHRLIALVILVGQWKASAAGRGDDGGVEVRHGRRAELHRFYLDTLRAGRVNNWDLIDASAEYLIGEYLLGEGADPRKSPLLDELAAAPSQWERRAAVLATFAFIKSGDPMPTLALAGRLLGDPEPLMHKAVGWMLREVGKRVSRDDLLGFLDANAGGMPRTMLSYATEHLAPDQRAAYRAVPRR